MTLFEDNVSALSQMGPRRRLRGDTGRLDENGILNPDPNYGLDTGYTWVRLRGERAAVAVINVSVTTQRANIPVILEQMDSGQLQIIGIDPEPALFTYGVFAPAFNQPDRIPEQDKSSIPHKRIKDLRLRLSSTGGLTFTIDTGVYQKLNGDLVTFPTTDIDVTASLPGSADTKRIVLIGITTSTNTITQSAAVAVGNDTVPTDSPYFSASDFVTARNAASSSVLWLWAFGLLNGETSIPNTDRFFDLRPIQYEEGGVYTVTASSPLASSSGNAPNISLTGTVPVANGGTGQTSATAAFNALSPLTTKGDLLANDGSNDVRLAVGTNGYVLRANSAATTGQEWSGIGATYEATVSTSDATVTTILAYAMTTSSAITIQARIIGVKTDYSAALVARLTAGWVRGAGSPALIGTGDLYVDENSSGAPIVSVDADAGTNSARIRVQGVAAESWSWKIQYSVVGV